IDFAWMTDGVSIGLEVSDTEYNGMQTESVGRAAGFGFGCVALMRRAAVAARGEAGSATRPFERNELLLGSSDDARFSIASIGVGVGVGVGVGGGPASLGLQAAWAAHVGVRAVVVRATPLASPAGAALASLARAVALVAAAAPHAHVLLRVPMSDAGWHSWNAVRALCGSHTRIGLALELCDSDSASASPSPASPTSTSTSTSTFAVKQSVDSLPASIQSTTQPATRWLAEPVALVVIPHVLFLLNKKNYPVLPKRHQHTVHQLLKLSPQFLVSCPAVPPISKENGGVEAYRIYIDHLCKLAPPDSKIDSFAKGYDDFLQAPLQPLMDNLESATYQVFERDPVKYTQYEAAIAAALADRKLAVDQSFFSVCVFGAGRGPLVDCVLRAASSVDCKVYVIALEKNPNAIVFLNQKKCDVWGDAVDVVYADMRYWVPTVK
ncbi:Protein arginine N-methyltransferase 5, partial [Physocladia obscura]